MPCDTSIAMARFRQDGTARGSILSETALWCPAEEQNKTGRATGHAPRSADCDRRHAGLLRVCDVAVAAAVADGSPGPWPGLLSVLAGPDRHRARTCAAGHDVPRGG